MKNSFVRGWSKGSTERYSKDRLGKIQVWGMATGGVGVSSEIYMVGLRNMI